MRPLIAALLLLLALPVRAEISEPSFNCISVTLTAIQTLLCEDPLLGAWEGQLAARAESAGAVAAHRAWLQGLGAECGLGDAKELSLPARWRAAPCMVEGMRHRLLAQNLVPDPAAAEAPFPGEIHPNCIEALAPGLWEGYSDDPVPLELCNEGNAHIPTRTYNDFLFNDGAAWKEGTRQRSNRGFFGYRVRGHLGKGLVVVRTVFSGGGSGVFSGVVFIRGLPELAPWPGAELSAVGGWLFGDRCNGGLRDVKAAGPAAIETAEKITPFDLFTLDDSRRGGGWRFARYAAVLTGLTSGQEEVSKIRSRGTIQLQPHVDLETSAVSCIGTVHYRYDLSGGRRELLGVTLDRLGGGGRLGACFDAVVGEAAGKLPHRFSPGELSALKDRFRKTCVE